MRALRIPVAQLIVLRRQRKPFPIVVALTSAILFSACSGAGATDAPPTSIPTDSPQTTTTESNVPTTVETEGEGPLYLRPIDSKTLKDLPGKQRLGVGSATWEAVSPDGRWLAVVSFSAPEGDDPRLTTVDLDSWSWSDAVSMPELEPISSIAITKEGTVVWIHSPRDHPYVYLVGQGETKPKLVVDLGTTRRPVVQPADIGMLSEGSLSLLAYEFDGEDYGGWLHVLGIDLQSGAVDDLTLPDVWHGHVPNTDIDQDATVSEEPGWVFDEPRGLLYVVPAQKNEVIVVDAHSMEITRRENWNTTETLLERLLAWWVPAAHAKGGEAARRQLAISPDGASLFVATVTPGFERIEKLDTETFEVVASSDFRPMEISLSPDGSVLLATDSFHPEGTESIDGGKLHVLDPDTLTTRTQILPDLDLNLSGYSGFSGDGRHAYAWNYSGESEAILYVAIELQDPRAVAVRKVYWPGFAIPHAGVLAAADR